MSNLTSKIIYLVDDDEDDRFIVVEAVKEVNQEISVIQLTNGRELLQHFEKGPAVPGLIVLDINMPEMNGWETLQAINRNAILAAFPVIMISTSPDMGLFLNQTRLDNRRIYTKPASFAGYVSIVRKLVKIFNI